MTKEIDVHSDPSMQDKQATPRAATTNGAIKMQSDANTEMKI